MGLEEDVRQLQNRRYDIKKKEEEVKSRAETLARDIKDLSRRVREGETTGDKVKDYVLAQGVSVTTGKGLSEVLRQKTEDIKARIALFSPGTVSAINRSRDDKVVLVDDPVYEVPDDFSAINLRFTDGIKVTKKKYAWFDVHAPQVDGIETGAINIVYLNEYEVNTGWAAIQEKYKRQPELLKIMLAHFNQDIPDALLQEANQLEDERVLSVMQQLDERVRSAHRLWEEVDKKRKKREELLRKQQSMRGSPVFGIRDQLERDSVDLELDVMMFKGPNRRDHDQATRIIVGGLQQAIAMGLHDYSRTITQDVRPGKKLVWDVAAYVRHIAGLLEVLYEPAEK